ncbi:MAG: MFS transporter, partial [Symbiobacteriaceae bacterium]
MAGWPGREPGAGTALASLPGGRRGPAAVGRQEAEGGRGAEWVPWAGAALLVTLAGRVQPAGLPSPLVLPLVAAVMEISPRLGWTVAFLGIAGALSAGAAYGAGVLLVATLLMRVLRSRVLEGDSGGAGRHRLQAAVLAGAVLLAGGVLAWPFGPLGPEVDRLAGVMVTAVLAVVGLPWMRDAAAFLLRVLPGAAGVLSGDPEARNLPTMEVARARAVLAVWMVVAVSALMVQLVEGGSAWPWLSGTTAALLAVSLAAGWLFVRQERRAPDPLLPLELLGRPVIRAGNLGGLVGGIILIGLSSTVPTFVQGVLGRSPVVAGFAVATLSIGWPLA